MPITDRRGRQAGGKRQAPSDNQTPAHSCRPVHTGGNFQAVSKRHAAGIAPGAILSLDARYTRTSSVCLAWDALVWLSPQRAHLPRTYRSSVYTTWRVGNAWLTPAACRPRLSVTGIMGFAVRVRSPGQKYGPACHQRDRANVTKFVTLVRLSSLGQHVGVLALAG